MPKTKQPTSDSNESSKKAKTDDMPELTESASAVTVDSPGLTSSAESNDGKEWNLKIASWNVNGVRAWVEKGSINFIKNESPDIFCVNETKCPEEKIPPKLKNLDGYHSYFLSGDKDGYSGVGLMSKKKPNNVTYGLGMEEHDKEGRVITAEYDDFYVVCTYIPNAGKKLVRLDYRQKWDKDLQEYLIKLDKDKPVVLCGDLNVAHQEIDLKNPKTNKRSAGFTQEERDGFTALLGEGFVDSFRHLYPDKVDAYTFWTYMMNARSKNVGWRLDYFVISERLVPKMCDSIIKSEILGSDHCPIVLLLSL